MGDNVYIFVDESGDPGDNDGTGANSTYYTELALQVDTEQILYLVRHIINWRYVKGMLGEPKQLPYKNQELKRFLTPFLDLHRDGYLKSSAVFLFKPNYTGPYLKGKGKFGYNPIFFRNFVHKQLLEYHLGLFPQDSNHYLEVIFDYYTMSKPYLNNVFYYLSHVCKLPLDSISHLDSSCSWMLQTAGQLANLISQVPFSTLGEEIVEMLTFIQLKDITEPV